MAPSVPYNRAFWFLCQVLQVVRENLPEEIVFYGAGKTELCHPRWDKNVEMWKQSKNYLGEAIAEETGDAVKKTLIFWLDELMAEHAMHGIWSHVLDGGCLLDQLDSDWLTYMYNVVWAMSITTVAWLYDACKQGRQRTLRVICAGKHRSVFFSRMLHQVYMLVFQLMRLRGRHELNCATPENTAAFFQPHVEPLMEVMVLQCERFYKVLLRNGSSFELMSTKSHG